jgi:hypothetical protein
LKAVGQGWVPNRACIDVGGRLAHAAVQAKMGESKKNEPDPAFSAVMSATKASFWWSTSHFGIPDEQPHIVFPVVVVDAPLISCALPRDGDELEIELIPSAITLRSLRPIGNRGVTAVDVVTASALADYVSQSATMAYDLGLRLIADTH